MVFYDSVFFSFLMMKLKFVYIKDEVINEKSNEAANKEIGFVYAGTQQIKHHLVVEQTRLRGDSDSIL